LVIDDNGDIHRDFRSILVAEDKSADFDAMESALFGDEVPQTTGYKFTVDSAFQGQEGVEMAKAGLAKGKPYAVAFVDMRMPPGWDGLETIDHLWQVDRDLEVVICTAYSDYSWDKIVKRTTECVDKLLILKKPFDGIEVQQIATALVRKWHLARQAEVVHESLEQLVEERTSALSVAEETARRAEKKWRSLLDNAPSLIVVINRQGEIEFVNHAIVSERNRQSKGFELFDFIEHQHRSKIISSVEKIFQDGEAPGCTVRGLNRSGKEAWYEVQFGTIRENAAIVAATLIATDISERRNIEAQLLQAQKLEAIGRLAGGVAHDINNILGVIMGAASVLELEIDAKDEKAKDIQRILSACRKGGRTTQDLLGFARKGKYIKENISFNKSILRIIELLKHTISKRITIRTELSERLHFVEGDLTQFDNALINICLNALDAMEGQGVLTIRTQNFVVKGTSEDQAEGLLPGDYVKVQFRDTGSGMDEETAARAFEPFFTTKAQGEGTGLGLSMVYGVVKNHGGVLNLHSELGKGTLVELLLPCTNQIAAEPPISQLGRRPSLIPQRGGILIIDDEEMLLMSTKRILKKLGYKVFLADGGRAALDQYRAHKGEIDAVLLDMIMPDLDGYETFFELKKQNPEVRVLLCSGYSKDKKVEELIESGALGFVLKPFDVTILTQELDGLF
jgi:PAS domain S-box-containing protein